ncbi:MAG: primosomal protein N' [Candidatus Omnitrophica bacterium]|nr:primosomal protein N' [Candidatus Omnitrophota bacterium]
MKQSIAQVVVGLPIEGPFDYKVEKSLEGEVCVGSRVYVSFGYQKKVGFVVGLKSKTTFKNIKPINSVLDNVPSLGEQALRLTKEISQYYGCSWGEAIETSLPNALRAKRSLQLAMPLDPLSSVRGSAAGQSILCHDPSGTKQWPWILDEIRKVVTQGKGVIFLVPEVCLITKVQAEIKKHYRGPVAILDKKLKVKEELEQWQAIKEGRVKVVVGTRSAVFAPVQNLGLMVVYEEENQAYKQEQSPFYHAREVAGWRAEIENLNLLFVSSAPSAEIWQDVKDRKIQRKDFSEGPGIQVQLIDLLEHRLFRKTMVSFPLQSRMTEVLSRGEKALLFLNRRGFSTITRCSECGYAIKCPRCDVSISYLYSRKKLACHLCNYTVDLPEVCPECQKNYMRSTGTGIEKIESELSRTFPQARIMRYDRESTNIPKTADIIIATQAVMRWLEPASVALVGVLDIDAELNRFDFRAAQRTFALLVHLRQAAKEKMMVQTYHRDNYCLQAAVKMDFDAFYNEELLLRKEMGCPPFKHIIVIVFRGKKEQEAMDAAQMFYDKLGVSLSERVEVSDPGPDIPHKLRDQYRFVIMLKGESVKRMLSLVKETTKKIKSKRSVIMTVNVNP